MKPQTITSEIFISQTFLVNRMEKNMKLKKKIIKNLRFSYENAYV